MATIKKSVPSARARFETHLQSGRDAREKGQQLQQAALFFWSAKQIAIEHGWWMDCIGVISEELLVPWHLFQKTKNRNYLVDMMVQIHSAREFASSRKVSGSIISILDMREAQCVLAEGKTREALHLARLAVRHMDMKDENPEVIGYTASLEVKHGQQLKGINILQRELKKLKASRGKGRVERDYLTVLCGFHLRLAEAWYFVFKTHKKSSANQVAKAESNLQEAYRLATVLAERFERPLRLKQVKELALQFEVELDSLVLEAA